MNLNLSLMPNRFVQWMWMSPRLATVATVLFLAACAPQQARSQSPEILALPESEFILLVEAFQSPLKQLSIQVVRGKAFAVPRNEENDLVMAVNQFYRESKGYCPLRDVAFHALPDERLFMSIIAKGQDIHLLIYDRSRVGELRYALAEGISTAKLPVIECRTS